MPPADTAAIRAVLATGTVLRASRANVAIHAARGKRPLLGRTHGRGGDAYAAELEPFESEPRMRVGEVRAIHFRVTNQGSETWPWDVHAGPEIRCAYRWLDLNEAVLGPEGHRTSFASTVRPGESVVVPLVVEAPAAEGAFLLEVDLVHEQVRWFDSPCRIRVTVSEVESKRAALMPNRAGNGHLPRRRPLVSRLGRRPTSAAEIPHVIHRVWLGRRPMPEELVHYGETWRRHHPGGGCAFGAIGTLGGWSPVRRPRELGTTLNFRTSFGSSHPPPRRSLRRHRRRMLAVDRATTPGRGGVFGYEKPGRVGTAVLAAVPRHPLFEDASEEVRKTVGHGANSADATGPYSLTLLVKDHPDVRILGPEVFYPYAWDEPHRRHDDFPDAYTAHHWTASGR